MKRSWIVMLLLGVAIGGAITYSLMPHPQPAPQPSPQPVNGSQPQWETDIAVITRPAEMDAAAPPDTPRYSLEDAASKGLIEYEIRGNGNSSGDSLMVAIRRLVDSDIDVYVVPGTVFRPSDDGTQPMVAWGVSRAIVSAHDIHPASSMYLPDNEVRVYSLEAYCLDFELENPSPQVTFQPQPAASVQPTAPMVAVDDRAAQLIYQGRRQGLSPRGIQVAIWADHNHVTQQEIQTKFDVKAQEMDDAFEMAKNMPPPRRS